MDILFIYLFTHPHRGNSVYTAADTCEITAWSSGGGGRSGQRKTGNRDGWKINSECQTSNSRQKANSLGCLSSGSRFEVNANWGKCAPGLCLDCHKSRKTTTRTAAQYN